MKKYIKSDSWLEKSGDNGKLTDISIKLKEVMSLCQELGDFYEDQTDKYETYEEICNCYVSARKALGCADRASAKLSIQGDSIVKKYIKSDSWLEESGDNGKITDLTIKLNEVLDICSDLEDFYFY